MIITENIKTDHSQRGGPEIQGRDLERTDTHTVIDRRLAYLQRIITHPPENEPSERVYLKRDSFGRPPVPDLSLPRHPPAKVGPRQRVETPFSQPIPKVFAQSAG
ncbi:hypothetical protein MLD38_037583 [Melastoma candidum]|uniref:Uncharacterized protein n=1 Tax=Melastoma candidum TaxID=119954 RepID=A0ACB9LN60_9MYRT|nr:hypothetical protein MLD38_037583 [Melastoma candidum]